MQTVVSETLWEVVMGKSEGWFVRSQVGQAALEGVLFLLIRYIRIRKVK